MAFDVGKFSKWMDIGSGASGLLTQTIQKGQEMGELPENNIQEEIDDLNSTTYNAGSYQDLIDMFNSTRWAKTNYNMWDLTGMTGGEAAGKIALNTIDGGLKGAELGTSILPGFGTLIGAAVGVTADALSSGFGWLNKKRKAHLAAQTANYYGRIANNIAMNNMQDNSMNIGKDIYSLAALKSSAYGGPLNIGDIFTNGVRQIEEGSSHENNPIGGVPQGIAQDGLPNLVEEGEVIYDDYVYSRRLKVPQGDKENLGLKKDKEYTYADAANQIQKESEERPNDPISKRNLDEMTARLQSSQEALKEKRDVQALKKAINKMTPDELAMFMQQLQQPQQMNPMLAMQGMQPMQPTQGEVPMFGKGGHLFPLGGPVSYAEYKRRNPSYSGTEQEYMEDMYETYGEDYINSVLDLANNPASTWNTTEGNTTTTNNGSDTITGNPWAQALRTAPVFGSLATTIASLFDKPNYSNIKRAEKAASAVPRISAGHIGQRLAYNPIDINFIATQQGNQGIGARRALFESGAGPQAIISNNYANQVAVGDAIMKATQLNKQNLAQALEFNRQTDSANVASNLQAALANQQRDMNVADFLFRTGQLRDAELSRVQANRSANLTNLFNNLGNLGTDMLNRDMARAMAESYGVTYNPYMQALFSRYGAKGGKLNTKKGGKDA